MAEVAVSRRHAQDAGRCRRTARLLNRGRIIPRPSGIAGVALAVRDLDRVGRFYQQVIGLSVLSTGPGGVRLGSGSGSMIELLHRPDAIPDDRKAAGLFHTAFLLPARSELGRWLRHAARIGQGLDGKADHQVSEAVYLSDPEGNGVEMYADRPPDTWRWRDGEIEMGNQPLDLAAILQDAGPDPSRDWTEAPPEMTIGHVHLRVGDARAAARFYTGPLGLQATRRLPNAAFMSWEGYHHHIACNDWQSRGAGPRRPEMAGLHSITVRLPDGQSMDDPSFVDDPWGNRIIAAT